MFAVLLLPHFRLQAALRHRAELRGRAVALVETDEARSGLREINAVAAAAGVVPGQMASQALARCAGERGSRPRRRRCWKSP